MYLVICTCIFKCSLSHGSVLCKFELEERTALLVLSECTHSLARTCKWDCSVHFQLPTYL